MADVGFDIEYDGKTWTVGKPTRAARDALGAAVVQAAWAEVEALRGVLPAAFEELRDAFLRLIGAREYKAGGKAWLAAVNGPGGNTLFLFSLLKAHHADATPAAAARLIAERPDAVGVALAVMVPDFFDFLAGEDETPPEMRAGFREAARQGREKAAASRRPPTPSGTPTPPTT